MKMILKVSVAGAAVIWKWLERPPSPSPALGAFLILGNAIRRRSRLRRRSTFRVTGAGRSNNTLAQAVNETIPRAAASKRRKDLHILPKSRG